jgi:hypothetical protein
MSLGSSWHLNIYATTIPKNLLVLASLSFALIPAKKETQPPRNQVACVASCKLLGGGSFCQYVQRLVAFY